MSSRTAYLLLMLLLAGRLYAQDWEGFAASSDRSQDSLILQTMSAGDLDTNIALCKGLGRRSDANVQAIIDSLAAGHASRSALATELLLRWLLSSALSANPSEDALDRWSTDNSASAAMLLERISDWQSPQLKGTLLKFAVIAKGPEGLQATAAVGALIVQELARSDGLIPSQDAALALDFMAAARKINRSELLTSEFLSFCTDIARLSRDKVIVDAARSAAAFLASAP